MAGKPIEQDVFFDVDGKPIFDAMRIVQMRIDQFSRTLQSLSAQTVQDVTKIKQIVDANIAALKAARSDLKALQEDRKVRDQGFVGAERNAKQRYDAERRAERAARRESLAEAKVFYGEEARDRTAANRRVITEEIAGEKLVMAANKQTLANDLAGDKARVASAKEVRRAKLEAAQAGVVGAAKNLTSLDEARAARAASAARLQQLRQERLAVASNNAEAARGIAERIRVEKALGAALDSNIAKLQRQQSLSSTRLSAFGARADTLLVPSTVQAAINSTGSRTGALAQFQSEQASARANLAAMRQQQGVSEELRRSAITRLDLANRHVRAAQALVNEEMRLGAAELKNRAARGSTGAGAPPSNPMGDILSPRYAGIALARTSVYGAAAAAAYGFFNVVQGGLGYVIQFEDELAKLSAIANATEPQMQKLKGAIVEIGSETRYATVEIAKIAQTLAQAGVSAAQMEDVLRAVTTLATASGSTPDEAVQLVTSALGSFQLQGSEAARVADLMTNALNRTKLTVQQVGQAIQYVGATAFEQNISLEQMLATVGAIAQAGVRSGSTIGTGFRQFLVDLQTPSEKLTRQLEALNLTTADVDVTVRGLPAVLDTLRNAGFGAAQAYTGLETRAAAFYLTAKNNTDVMDMLLLSFANSNAAAIANERAMGSLTAQWQRFKNIMADGFEENTKIFFNLLEDGLRVTLDLIEQVDAAEKKRADRRKANPDAWDFRIEHETIRDFLDDIDGEANAASRGGKGIGTWLYELEHGAAGAAGGMEELQTSVNEASEAVDIQRGTLTELEKEYQRLLVQKNDLINNDTRSQAEMVSLMARFEGLSGYLTNTKNQYVDLTNAVRGFITAQGQALTGNIATQQSAITTQNSALRGRTTELMRDVLGSNKLTQNERAAVNSLSRYGADDPEFQRSVIVIADAARRLTSDPSGIGAKLDNLAGVLNDRAANVGMLRVLGNERARLAGQNTRQGREVYSDLQQAQALVTQSQGAVGGNQTRLTGQATEILDETITFLRGFRPDPKYKGYFDSALQDALSLKSQINAILQPSAAEEKAVTAAAREAEREQRRGPPVTQEDLDNILKEFGVNFGRGNDSSPAARAAQNRMHRQGLTPATADTSSHTREGGVARDIRLGGMSDADARRLTAAIQARLKNEGIDALVQFETGQGRNQGTGRHIHVNTTPGARRAPGDAGDQTIRAQAYAARMSKAQLDLDEEELSARLKELAASTTRDTFIASMISAEAALERVKADLMVVAEDELAAGGFGPGDPEYAARMRQVEQATANAVEAFQTSIVDSITKNLEAAFKAAAVATANAMNPAVMEQAIANASQSGLGYASLAGRVPDYVGVLAERRSALADEGVARARAGALPAEIARNQSALARAQDEMAGVDQQSVAWTKAAEAVAMYTQKLEELNIEKTALDTALAAGSQIPTTITAGLQSAIEAYKETHELGRSFNDEVIYNLGGAIEQVHTGLTTFFTDIFTGSKSALGAFGDFALGMANYLQQMAAQFVASKIFALLLKIGSAALAPGVAGGDASWAAASMPPGFGAFNGGKVPEPQGFRWGGKVNKGSPLRDSVSATLAKDEWVINKRAVDSVGDEFMDNLNRNGIRALSGLGAPTNIMQAPRQETNVYVVKPEEAPQMGPNDVRVTLHDELINGEGRKLVKHIAQGG